MPFKALLKLSKASAALALLALASTTKPLVRSTKVPTEEQLPAPLMRSPSSAPESVGPRPPAV